MSTTTILQKESKTASAKKLIRETFPVLEMSCASCAVSIESMLKSVNGVKDAGVNYANQTAWVDYDPALTNPSAMRDIVRSIGYDLVIEKENAGEIKEAAQRKQYSELRKRTLWSLLLSVPIVVIAMFFMNIPFANWIMMVLAAPVVFYLGRNFFINAWRQATNGRANMDTLVALSTGVAFLFSAFNTAFPSFWHQRGLHPHVYFEAAAVIVGFISLGKLLEEKAKSNTSAAIKKLMGLQPQTVWAVHENGDTSQIPVQLVKVNDLLMVKPGEKIAVDGVVTSGESYVDESMITGEPIAVVKKDGAKVFAGTINQKGSFVFRAEKVGSDTMLARIIKMVQEAQGSKAPVQKLVDKIAGIFVPVVIAISLLTFIAWMIFGGDHAFTHALLATVTVLVIACPCALGLATPTAIMVGVGRGAENNILVRDAESLEMAHRVNVMVLDKTGTITEGHPQVTDTWFADQSAELRLKSILLAIEKQSEHPLADAIVQHLSRETLPLIPVENIQSITGRGLRAIVQHKEYLLGNSGLMKEQGIEPGNEIITKIQALEAEAKTVIVFAEERKPVAIIAISDKIKEGSVKAIQSLISSGIEVYMLTGDNRQTAEAIARQAGIRQFQSEMLPGDKAAFINKLKAEGKIVAMAGDGINDAQALAQADVSMAMGKGTDIAMDVAMMTLITSDLNAIPTALKLSRKTVSAIRQNLFWAFIYNLIGIPIAAGILYPVNGFLLNPMIAGAAMALSSVSVVTNSLRLKWTKI